MLRLPSATVIFQTHHSCSYSFLNPQRICICRSSFDVTALCVHHPVPHSFPRDQAFVHLECFRGSVLSAPLVHSPDVCSNGLLLKCGSSCFQTHGGEVQSITRYASKHSSFQERTKQIQFPFWRCSGVKILPRSSCCPQKMPINRPLTYGKILLLID